MATLYIPDGILERAGVTEREVLIEVACRLFDSGKLSLHGAGELAGLHRDEIEDELMSRGIAVYRPTVEDVEKDFATMQKLFGDRR